MKSINKELSELPQERISLLPTPFHRLGNISDITGCNIFIKRDDLTGFALSGNKTRKFDFLIADAIKKDCDTIIGIGANQSNFCRILSGVGAKYGFSVHLILSGKKPEKATGNLLIDHMLGSRIHHIDTLDSEERMNYALEIKEKLIEEGKKVYFLPPGGSTSIGTYGYAQGFGELLHDFKKHDLKIDRILHASSSAGTQAGLVLGQAISGWQGQISGISVDVPAQKLKNDVYALAKSAGANLEVKIDPTVIHTDDSYVGEGYGIKTEGCIEAVDLFAKKEGIFLDYVYTGKAGAGLFDYCRTGKINPSENTVFIHTGGNIELFA